MSVISAALLDDSRFMAAAVRFARRNLGLTAENPSVGVLIVRDDGVGPWVVGRGVTAAGGRPHAEIVALEQAGKLARGATAYVTLEPCSHFGKTPPCADALIAAGIRRVVVAAGDPDPRVNGRGIERLRQAGLEVVEHFLSPFAEDSMSAYLCRRQKQRPEITLKLAVSADGCIGRQGEGNVLISGAVSQEQSHILRAQSDAILVGVSTVIADDPMLDCRLPGLEARSPVRIVLDSHLRIPAESRLVLTAKKLPLWVYCGDDTDHNRQKALVAAGCRVFPHYAPAGKVELHGFATTLAQAGISSLLVEGGAEIAASFQDTGLIDRLIVFQSPVIIGCQGYRAPDFVMKPAGYEKVREEQLGGDCCIEWKRIR